jgi:hypothetical protein
VLYYKEEVCKSCTKKKRKKGGNKRKKQGDEKFCRNFFRQDTLDIESTLVGFFSKNKKWR